jgi:hypothetical protein
VHAEAARRDLGLRSLYFTALAPAAATVSGDQARRTARRDNAALTVDGQAIDDRLASNCQISEHSIQFYTHF